MTHPSGTERQGFGLGDDQPITAGPTAPAPRTSRNPLGIARIVIVVSTLAALVAHAWLSADSPWTPTLMIAAIVIGLAGGRLWRRGTQAGVLALGHVWPLVSTLAFGPDALALLVWVAALAALAIASTPLASWGLPPRWRLPMAAWGMLLALGWPIVLARELDFTLLTYVERGVSVGVISWPARYNAAMAVGGCALPLASILVLDWLCARYQRQDRQVFAREVALPLTLGTLAALTVGAYQGLVDLHWWSGEPWPRLGRAAGTLYDANAFGAIAALWAAPVAGAALLAERKAWRVAGLALLALAAVGVWVCGSRTALLGIVPVFGGIALALTRAGRLSRLTMAAAVVTIAAMLGAGWLAGGSGSAVRRVWGTLPSPSATSVATFAGQMLTRNGYGAAAIEMIGDFPLTGVGPGAFPGLSTDYWYRATREIIPPDNAQNWWRHQLTEFGLVAGLVPIACSLLVFGALVGTLRAGRTPVATIAGSALVGAAAMSLLGSPAAHPIVLLTITIVIFSAMQGAYDAPQAPQAPQAPWILLVVFLLPLTWASGTAWTAVTQLRPALRAETFGWLYAYGLSAPETLGNGREQRWLRSRAVGVVPSVGAHLVMTFTAPADNPADTPVHVRVATRHAVLLDANLAAGESSTIRLDLTGRQWTMVQIDSSGPERIVDNVPRTLRLTSWVE